VAFSLLAAGGKPIALERGYLLHAGHFELPVAFVFEPASAFYLVTAQLILLLAIRFSVSYLHREAGLQRFMMLMSLCQIGVFLVLTSRHLSFLFVGWECVGVASTVLISFFDHHPAAARRSAKAFASYRVADVGLIIAAAMLHAALKSDDLLSHHLVVSGGEQAAVAGAALALIWGSLAKASVFPFMTWMPQAMEGPTPSSAVFYGALSVHLGPMLLLRTFHIWHDIVMIRYLVAALGCLTAVLGATIGRTQSNVKTQLVYAVMAQIGIMYVELALGWTNLVVFHMCSHALLRAYQFLRSASLLADFQGKVEVSAEGRSSGVPWIEAAFAPAQRPSWYLHAWSGFYIEAWTRRFISRPVEQLAKTCLRIVSGASSTTPASPLHGGVSRLDRSIRQGDIR
jgi:NADH:ubiquinone oxidoreductase subunit 5 (subunit L)/multisubunit Na+/H+ antiporter MnhA subunit